MIRLIHRYKESIGIVFLIVAVCFAFSGVGLDMLQRNSSQSYAIRVNDKEISPQEVAGVEEQIARQYGRGIPTDRIVDMLVNQNLIEQESHNVGFRVSDNPEKVREMIAQQFFPDGVITKERYLGLVRSMGLTPAAFERKVRNDRQTEMYIGLLTDVSFATKREATAELTRQKTEYTITGIEVKPADLAKSIPTPSEAETRKFYEENATEYEVPARASYDYIVLDPNSFKQAVPVTPQDVEMYYSENPNQFQVPEQAKIRVIKVLYPKDSDPTKMAESKEKAMKAHEEALAGKPFEALVANYSDDIAAKATGGDLGWVELSKLEEPVSQSLSKLRSPGIADLVELDYGFQVIKIDDYKVSSTKPLSEVTSEIENILRERDAPSFANAEALRLVSLSKQGKSLQDIATESKQPLASTNGLLDAKTDPTPTLKGLTAKIITLPKDERSSVSLHDIGDTSVLVAAKEIKDPETASYDSVKEKVIAAYIKKQSESLAQTKASEVLEKLRAKPDQDIPTFAKELGFTVKGPDTLTAEKPGSGWIANPEISEAVFKVSAAKTVLARPFRVGDTFVVAQVIGIKKPELKVDDPKVDEFRATASQILANQVIQSTLATLKNSSEVDIDPSLMGR